jgi:hypothetical protein
MISLNTQTKFKIKHYWQNVVLLYHEKMYFFYDKYYKHEIMYHIVHVREYRNMRIVDF